MDEWGFNPATVEALATHWLCSQSRDGPPNPISWQEQSREVLMPMEEGNYPISLKRFPQMRDT
ncbi:hypothetical protein GCM10009539_37450 [Cryptosporangium japonicum]|uniref:Uncharacterized protein n=1 Tax=Cryptosporangium japonicum TaxID=80872 RepID=A0ABN0UFU3_9ACTN